MGIVAGVFAARAWARSCAVMLGIYMITGALSPALAQTTPKDYPQRPVKFVLALGPGSASDIGARLLAERLQARWGKPVTVENRPGGDGLVALGAFVTAADDHVLFYGATGTFTVHPYMHDTLPYDVDRDLLPIAETTTTVPGVGVPASMGVATLPEFIARARAAPGTLNAAVPAGISEFALDRFLHEEKLAIRKVPYRDVVQAGTDVDEGRIHMIVVALAILRPHLDGGRMKLIAVTTAKPTAIAPGVPTVFQAGVPSLELEGLNGVFGPRGMPLETRARIGAEVVAAFDDPVVTAKLQATGQDVTPGGPDELAAAMARQIATVDRMAKDLGIARKLKR